MAKYSWLNITQPELTGYQVRVTRGNQQVSAYFPFLKYGGKRAAFVAANRWRDRQRRQLATRIPRVLRRDKATHSTGICGISCRLQIKHRSNGNTQEYLAYTVTWTDALNHERRKTFHVGNVDTIYEAMDRHAFAAAKAFRAEWEWHDDHGLKDRFDPSKYDNWRNMDFGTC